jgi:hypothetical protein
MTVLVYLVVFSITELVTGVIVTPAGPDSREFTVSGTSTNELNSTEQVRVTLEPIGRMGLIGLLVVTTVRFGAGGNTY